MHKQFTGIIGLFIVAIVVSLISLVYNIVIEISTLVGDNIDVIITVIITVILSGLALVQAYLAYVAIYFRSKNFIRIKEGISKHTNNCNELNQYIEGLKSSYVNIESYNYGTGEMIDNSLYNFERKEWSKATNSNQVHHCSAVICKNASNQPIKYLCKYFDIEKDEESLSKFEKVLNDFTSVEQGRDLIKRERESILSSIDSKIPFIIRQFNEKKLIRKLGFETVDISDSYIPTFSFQYVSAGGNSSSNCDIALNIENLNHLINYLNDVIKWRKSVEGQRALMTSKLRDEIKKRDNFKCNECGLGIKDEPNLLLEIDHIVPVSKGGMTTYDNLQTLCWKCNRTKGAKILTK